LGTGLGGNARTVAAFSGLTAAAISPDEKRLAFPRGAGEDRGLFIANVDGSGERQLATRKAPDSFNSSAWSPDGKTIAYGVRSATGPSTALAAVSMEGGPERSISSRLGGVVWALRWMPDGNGLIATANPQYPFHQLWYVNYPVGRARSITNDLNSYSGLSLTGDGGALVTVQNETISHLWVVTPGDPGSAREISTGRLDGLNFVAFAGNGNLYFEAPDSSGTSQIWSTAPDGAGRRQITRGEGLTGTPVPCGDDRHLLFTSYRTGIPHIFLSDLDGGDVRQLTNGAYEFMPSCSPDGSWLTYRSSDSKSLGVWRIQIDGGSPVRIWDRYAYAEISPDGKSILVTGADGKVTIVPAGGGQPIRSLEEVPWLAYFGVVHWSADGAALLYVKTTGGVSNVWRRPLDGGEPTLVTSFTTERITSFAVSRDGKRLALARGTTSSDVVLMRDLK
jgi:Tol biopolymer transport system component